MKEKIKEVPVDNSSRYFNQRNVEKKVIKKFFKQQTKWKD